MVEFLELVQVLLKGGVCPPLGQTKLHCRKAKDRISGLMIILTFEERHANDIERSGTDIWTLRSFEEVR